MSSLSMRAILEQDMQSWSRRLHRPLIEALLKDLEAWPEMRASAPDSEEDAVRRWSRFLRHHVEVLHGEIDQLHRQYAVFMQRYDGSATGEERQRHMLEYAAQLGSSAKELAEDRKAFSRWFDLDALRDRMQRRLAERERRMAFALRCLGSMVARELLVLDRSERGSRWHTMALEELLRPLLAYEGDERVAEAAFVCLASSLRQLPRGIRLVSVSDATLQYIYRAAMESRHGTRIQRAALALLAELSMDSFRIVVRKRLERPGKRSDDIFVRRRVVALLAAYLAQHRELVELMPLALGDPSPYVRQGLATALARQRFADVRPWLAQLARHDDSPKVRAAAWVALARERKPAGKEREWALDLFCDALEQEQDPFALRVALVMAGELFARMCADNSVRPAEREAWQKRLLPCLKALHEQADSLLIRREAARVAERIWVHG
ncbi:MAG: hypothetical protein D6794_06015, partial [Deltaproteobacteria bacterium]